MKNKKGWLRIVEASIAILIIASATLLIIYKEPTKSAADVHEIQRNILELAVLNESIRASILRDDVLSVELYIEENTPSNWNYTIRICEVDEVCGMPFYINEDVYADEILVAANLTKYSPKKLKMFMWEK